MKTRKVTRLALAMLMTALLSVLAAAPAFAAVNPGDTYGQGIDGGQTNLKKYLVVDDGASIPTTVGLGTSSTHSFTFTVTAGSGTTIASGNTTDLPVTPGPNPDDVLVNVRPFGPSDTTDATLANAKIATGDSTLTGKKAAVKDAVVSFELVKFPKPGVYRYVITENNPAAPFSKVTGMDTITMDVYVENSSDADATNGLKITKYAAYRGTVTANPKKVGGDTGNAGTKADFFANQSTTYSLTVKKEISGNQADLEGAFEIKVEISGLTNGDVINVGSDTTVSSAATSYTAADGKITATLNYSNNEQLVLTGIPSGATYTVTETKANQDGYATTYDASNTGTLSADTTVTVKNVRQGAIPTGVMTAMIPGLILVALAVLVLMRRRAGSTK